MKKISFLFSFLMMLSVIACSGDSSEEPVPNEGNQNKNFSLKVQLQDKCENNIPQSNVTILVYDESPNQNQNSNFTTYITDADGLLGLNLDSGAKVSFSVIYYPDQHYPNGQPGARIITYIDINVDTYTINMSPSRLEDQPGCDCQTVSFDAEVDLTSVPNHSINWVDLYWGRSTLNSAWSINGASISFSDVVLCGDDNDLPLFITANTGIGDEGFSNVSIGSIENPDINNLNSPVQMNPIPQNLIPVPINLAGKDVSHSRFLDNVYYLGDSSTGPDILSLDEFDLGLHYYSVGENISGTYNGTSLFGWDARISINSLQESSDLSLIGDLPSATSISVNFDEENLSYDIDTQDNSDYDFLYSYHQFVADGKGHTWTVYSPVGGTTFFPKLTSELEISFASLELIQQFFTIKDIANTDDYSSALKARSLNPTGFPRAISSRQVRVKYDDFPNQNRTKTYPIHRNDEPKL